MTELEKQLVRELREETGHGMMDCKRALQECNWNRVLAKLWLDEREKFLDILPFRTRRP
jgi:elongation factor Ts